MGFPVQAVPFLHQHHLVVQEGAARGNRLFLRRQPPQKLPHLRLRQHFGECRPDLRGPGDLPVRSRGETAPGAIKPFGVPGPPHPFDPVRIVRHFRFQAEPPGQCESPHQRVEHDTVPGTLPVEFLLPVDEQPVAAPVVETVVFHLAQRNLTLTPGDRK